MRPVEKIHPSLPPLRLVNRRTLEHVGACPFCGGDHRSDRFHVWMEPGKERFWCRACDAKGPLKKLLGEEIQPRAIVNRQQTSRPIAQPNPAHIAHYRQIYAMIALWGHTLLLDEANPEPLAYIRQRGITEAMIGHQLLGVTLRDPTAIPDLLRRECPDLLPYAEAAGVLIRDASGDLRAHPNLCGALLFPYLADGEVVDLRARSFPGKGYRSLPGGYSERGATAPFGWDSLDGGDTIILTEGEFKALAVTQAYRADTLSLPALAHPGLSYLREEWAAQLMARGVRTVILAYDSGPRPVKDGALQLAPEETWSIRHGLRLAAAGLDVRVLRLPLDPGQQKADLDAFLLDHHPARLQHLIDSAPSLRDYHRSLPRHLLQQANIDLPGSYPTRRARPQRLEASAARPAAPPPSVSLEQIRAQIAQLVQQHATDGQGFLVLAHAPGVGKGHNTVEGLRAHLRNAESPGQIVWTAPRKQQIHDQTGLDLIPLHGRNDGNCRRLAEAQTLAAKGYPVRQALCERRCPFVDHCPYLRQFGVEADRFAPQPLLLATGWWQEAGVLVMDEFNPAQLTNQVTLSSADLAAIGRSADCPHTQALLRWMGQILGTTSDRTLTGGLLLAELDAAARAEGLAFAATLTAAEATLPDAAQQALLPGIPNGAPLAAFQALPPNYRTVLIRQLAREQRRHRMGTAFTSRIEVGNGLLRLFLRHEHLIAQLANPQQPKIILDATVNTPLLQAIFPDTPIQIEQPPRTDQATVIQVISRDWAKSTLHGPRRDQWYDAVAQHIRPARPTLVVCTLAAADDLRRALAARGHPDVVVAHYGALRGTNAYTGYDVILAQVYHPNLEAITRAGRALFADDAEALDERIITTDQVLTDATGARWAVQVPTFADARLAALLESQREAEMVQCAMRGRPLDHPEVQITLLFGLPIPGLTPTEIREDTPSPTSNGGRQAAAVLKIIASAKVLLEMGQTRLAAIELAQAAEVSEVTVRTHWKVVAETLGLSDEEDATPSKRCRRYRRRVLVSTATERDTAGESTDQADNKDSLTCLIHTAEPDQPISANVSETAQMVESVPANEKKLAHASSSLSPCLSKPLAMSSAPSRPQVRFVRRASPSG
ncbi:hypothetical protein EKD04_020725 [Chloroflexales bacterium ZM16-3]|nr:hypothetical protein [Chloroflexales bacterium ZM16-3]